MNRPPMTTHLRPLRGIGFSAVLCLLASPLTAQSGAAVTRDLVRQVLSSPDDGAAWSALESEAAAAGEEPFTLRNVRVDEEFGGLLLDLGGYGLTSLVQVTTTAGTTTQIVVSLPDARTALPGGFELAGVPGMTDVRVRQEPFGVEVEANLAAGTAAVIDETAEGVRVRPVGGLEAVQPTTSLPEPAAARGLDRAAVTLFARSWLDALKAGRPLAVFPLLAVGVLTLLALLWLTFRSRPTGRLWHSVADAQRLADKLSSPRNW